MVLVLVTLWSLASNHCKIEQLTASDLIDCCNIGTTADQPDSDCDTDGCASLEKSIYKTEDGQLAFHAPAFTKIFTPVVIEKASSQLKQAFLLAATAPPEISVGWQFSSRTAATPRSPSFAS